MKSRNRIPDRWEDYTNIGQQIKGTRFICFKVPLEMRFAQRLSSEDLIFTPEMLVEKIKEMNLELGAIVDLTNTDRYYDPSMLKDLGINHEKINTVGHVVPRKDVRQKFYKAVDNFLKGEMTEGSLVGVHCTHGLNRTGFLICRYMMDRIGFTADEAITAFNEARGHDMERENYLTELRTGKSHEDPDYVDPPEEERPFYRRNHPAQNRDQKERENWRENRGENRGEKREWRGRQHGRYNDRPYNNERNGYNSYDRPERQRHYDNGHNDRQQSHRGNHRDSYSRPYRGHHGNGRYAGNHHRDNSYKQDGGYRDYRQNNRSYDQRDERSRNDFSRQGIPPPYQSRSGGYNNGYDNSYNSYNSYNSHQKR